MKPFAGLADAKDYLIRHHAGRCIVLIGRDRTPHAWSCELWSYDGIYRMLMRRLEPVC